MYNGASEPSGAEGTSSYSLKQLNFALSKGLSDGELVDFRLREAKILYFFRHVPIRCWHLPHVLLSDEPLLQDIHQQLICPLRPGRGRSRGAGASCCRVASLGGGPGFDAIGLSLMAVMQQLHVQFEVTNYDIEATWEEVVQAVDTHLCAPLGHVARFGVCDITEGLDPAGSNSAFTAALGPAADGFDIFAVEFVVAENSLKLEATDFLLFRQLFRRVPPSTVFVFMDATHRYWARLVAVAAEEGRFDAALPHFEAGKSLFGFPKHVLVLRKQPALRAGEAPAASARVSSRLAWFESHRKAHGEWWKRRAAGGDEDSDETSTLPETLQCDAQVE